MNAKLVERGGAESEGIGQHVFGEGHNEREAEGVEDNRNLLKETLIDAKPQRTNTLSKHLQKQ